jgi:hypothetical protein
MGKKYTAFTWSWKVCKAEKASLSLVAFQLYMPMKTSKIMKEQKQIFQRSMLAHVCDTSYSVGGDWEWMFKASAGKILVKYN